VLSFPHKVFVGENVRSIPAAELTSRLDDELYALNERSATPQFPMPADCDRHDRLRYAVDALASLRWLNELDVVSGGPGGYGPSGRLEQGRVGFGSVEIQLS
jgi:hypothetical protein